MGMQEIKQKEIGERKGKLKNQKKVQKKEGGREYRKRVNLKM